MTHVLDVASNIFSSEAAATTAAWRMDICLAASFFKRLDAASNPALFVVSSSSGWFVMLKQSERSNLLPPRRTHKISMTLRDDSNDPFR